MPAFGRTDGSIVEPAALVVGGGRIWIKDFDAPPIDPPRWSVVSLEGDLLAIVELPPGAQLLDGTETAVLGLWRDALDIPHVRVYALRL